MESKATLVMTILLLATLGGGGWLFYKNNQLKKNLNENVSHVESLQGELNNLSTEKSTLSEDLKKKKQLLDQAASENEKIVARLHEEMEKKKEIENKFSKTVDDLKKEIDDQRVKISELNGVIKVQMENKILFPSGEATVSEDGKSVLKKVASGFSKIENKRFRIEGHTDNVPISNSRFPSNWELSATRAANVLHVILKSENIDPKKFEIVGMGQFNPVAPNDTEENKAQNRRIEILLIEEPKAILKKSIHEQ